jgi:uncharacterized protein (DUF362 family)
MRSKVALIRIEDQIQASFDQALELIGGLRELNTPKRAVTIKVGVFSPNAENHTSVTVVNAIARSFDKAPQMKLVESDNYRGKALNRLQIWKELFSSRLVPFSLSDDPENRKVKVADEEMSFSNVLFKPNVFVSTHVLRSYERGSVLKNLLGLVPDTEKARFHKKLDILLPDIFEAIGGIDLAVLDGTYLHRGVGANSHVNSENAENMAKLNILLVGRDAVAVETIGAIIAGLHPEKMSILQEFVKRGLGEGDPEKIEVVGDSLEKIKRESTHMLKTQKSRSRDSTPQTWGGQAHRIIKNLVHDGFFSYPKKRTRADVAIAFEARGLSVKGRKANLSRILSLRVKKGILKTEKNEDEWIYWTE